VGTAHDVTEQRRGEDQRERAARLAGMLFQARSLASRLTDKMAASSGTIDPGLRAAADALAAELSSAIGNSAELQRLSAEPAAGQPRRPAPES
jgi:hypothetical protein